jgi:phosphoglycerate dehydrogenase-like enzyme
VARQSILVTYGAGEEERKLLEEVLGGLAHLTFLKDLSEGQRGRALGAANILLSFNPTRELREHEFASLRHVRFLQLATAGADHLPFSLLPPHIRIASNVGAFAKPMAEHILAMTLALAKRLLVSHSRLAAGEFDHRTPSRMLSGLVAGMLGLGGIGRAGARLLQGLDMKIYGINTSGQTSEPVEFIGTLDDLEHVLRSADVLIVALPLTRRTQGLLGSRELSWMKPDAILINVARGEIIDERALYEHLKEHPNFMVGIDAWWIEPLRHGEFRINHPFFELPNFLGSPHNSAVVPGIMVEAIRYAAENVLRFLRGNPIAGVVRLEDYVSPD